MLKQMTLVGAAVVVSSGLAIAGDGDSMMGNSATAENSYTVASATDSTQAEHVATVKKHKAKHAHHRSKHAKAQAAAMPLATNDMDKDYKNDGALATVPSCPACEHITINQGPYLGFGIGSRYNLFSVGSSYAGLEGTLFAGYSMMWQQLYTAFEVFGQDAGRTHDYKGLKGTAASSWGYGISLLPGYMVTDNFLSYLRLGMVRTKFKNHNQNANGAQAGIGIQTAVSNTVEVRGEWDYTFYKRIGIGIPHTQQFSLGLVYRMPV